MGFQFDIRKLFKKHAHEAILFQIESVQQSTKNAVKFIKEFQLSHKAFQQLPWYIVIGPRSTGKTQLISKSNLAFLESNKFVQITPENMDTEGGVNWWISPAAVLIDVPGYFLEDTTEFTPARAAWLELLRQIRRYRHGKALNGIILTFSVEDVEKLDKTEKIFPFKSRITEITRQLKQKLPAYLTITKTDKLLGFNEYFDDLGQKERDECCGLTFPLNMGSSVSWVQIFENQFDCFVSHLQQRVLWRVHHEHQLMKRQQILNFPYQLESLKENFKKIIYSLNTLSEHIFLRGLYFTSSLQLKEAAEDKNQSIDFVSSVCQKQFNLLPMHDEKNNKENYVNKQISIFQRFQQSFHYFIPSIFEQKILPEAQLGSNSLHKLTSTWENTLRWLVLGFSGIFLSAAIVFFSHEYHRQIHFLNTAKIAISDYKILMLTNSNLNTPSNVDENVFAFKKLLPALDALSLAAQNAKAAHLPWLLQLQLHHKVSVAQKTQGLYHQALLKKFLPAIRDQIENQLKSQNIMDTTQLYGLLKIYLMLSSSAHMESAFLKHWFYHDFQSPLMQNPDFTNHLDNFLNQVANDKSAIPNLTLNNNLVSQVRGALNALPYMLLGQAIFKNNYTQMDLLTLNVENAIHTFELPTKSFSSLSFAGQNIQQIKTQINQSLWEAVKGNWVLGDKKDPDLISDQSTQIAELQKTFLADYLHDQQTSWMHFLSQIKLKKFSSLSQLDLSLQELTSKHSPLMQIFMFMEANHINFNNNFDKIPIKEILSSLERLDATIIRPVLNSPNQDESALVMAQNIAKQTPQRILFDKLYAQFNPLPDPLKNWLLTLTQRSHELLFAQGLQYGSSVWKTKILPLCQKKIDNHYPFDPESENDVSLKDFSQFFERGGIFDQFLKNYLSPFIDTTSNAKWQWKNIDGIYFSTNHDFLYQLERANIIQTLYFNQKNQLYMPFTFAEEDYFTHYVWPLDKKITDENHQLLAQGDWSIFKLIHQGQFTRSNKDQTQQYQLTIGEENHKKVYTLTPDTNFNPLLGIINHLNMSFKCPANL